MRGHPEEYRKNYKDGFPCYNIDSGSNFWGTFLGKEAKAFSISDPNSSKSVVLPCVYENDKAAELAKIVRLKSNCDHLFFVSSCWVGADLNFLKYREDYSAIEFKLATRFSL